MIEGLLKASGILVFRLVYGKYYAPEDHSLGLMLLLSVVNCAWLMALLFSWMMSKWYQLLPCILFIVGYPALLVLWRVKVQKKYAHLLPQSTRPIPIWIS